MKKRLWLLVGLLLAPCLAVLNVMEPVTMSLRAQVVYNDAAAFPLLGKATETTLPR